MNPILPRPAKLDIGTAIRCASAFLERAQLTYGHGTTSALDDAAWLVLEAAGQSPVESPDYHAVLTQEAIERCESWLHERAVHRVPVAYLVGRTWFAGLEFTTDQRALIPRSPIAELIEHGFHGLVTTERRLRVLDLCTGGGCIAVAIAHWFPEADVVGTDVSTDALALAAENVARHQVQQRVTLLEGNLYEPVTGGFDLIVANPPYVDREDIEHLAQEFRYEPAVGLASGPDGLDITRRILRGAAEHLLPGGVLVVEVGNSAQALDKAYPGVPFLWLDFQNGGDGVFALTRETLSDYQSAFHLN